MQLSIYCVLSARHVSGLHAHLQELLHSIYQLFFYLFILTTYLQDTICCICNLTSIAREDGRVSPKHVELKIHNKYSIALSW